MCIPPPEQPPRPGPPGSQVRERAPKRARTAAEKRRLAASIAAAAFGLGLAGAGGFWLWSDDRIRAEAEYRGPECPPLHDAVTRPWSEGGWERLCVDASSGVPDGPLVAIDRDWRSVWGRHRDGALDGMLDFRDDRGVLLESRLYLAGTQVGQVHDWIGDPRFEPVGAACAPIDQLPAETSACLNGLLEEATRERIRGRGPLPVASSPLLSAVSLSHEGEKVAWAEELDREEGLLWSFPAAWRCAEDATLVRYSYYHREANEHSDGFCLCRRTAAGWQLDDRTAWSSMLFFY